MLISKDFYLILFYFELYRYTVLYIFFRCSGYVHNMRCQNVLNALDLKSCWNFNLKLWS